MLDLSSLFHTTVDGNSCFRQALDLTTGPAPLAGMEISANFHQRLTPKAGVTLPKTNAPRRRQFNQTLTAPIVQT